MNAPPRKTGVVTRTLNRPELLRRAARSVTGQTSPPDLWVVVNDGGDPSAVEAAVAEVEGASPVQIIHHAQSKGMEAAGNAGVEALAAAGCDRAAIHDDDDTWDERFLEQMNAAIDAMPSAVGAVCNWVEIFERLKNGAYLEEKRSRALKPGALTLPRLAVRNRFPPIALLFGIDAWRRAGRFDEALPVLGDWSFNLRLLERGDLADVDATLAYQHIRRAAKGAASNSIIAKKALHERTKTLMINAFIRNAPARSESMLPQLLATAEIHEDAAARTSLKAKLLRLVPFIRTG